MALALQAALLTRNAPSAVADGFLGKRLGAEWSANYGATGVRVDVDAIIARQALE
jgi:putative acyl-CoA dehydrogenase